MKKIPTLFVRESRHPFHVIARVNLICDWVLQGHGVATEKLDGTACLWHDGKLWKRRSLGKGGTAPADFIEADFDDTTGKRFGWIPVGAGPEDAAARQALTFKQFPMCEGQTYELIGPSIQGNPYEAFQPSLFRHGGETLFIPATMMTFAGLREWLAEWSPIEGIVWHHADGRMAKLKRRDFGLPWPVRKTQ